MSSSTIISSSAEETERAGEEFSKSMRAGDIVCLYGDLGSGKTTFVKGVAKGLGITSRVISPTFVIVRKHKTRVKNLESRVKYIYHIDLYRLENEKDVIGVDLKDILEDEKAVILIEWAEKADSILSKKRWKLIFEHTSKNSRKIEIQYTQ